MILTMILAQVWNINRIIHDSILYVYSILRRNIPLCLLLQFALPLCASFPSFPSFFACARKGNYLTGTPFPPPPPFSLSPPSFILLLIASSYTRMNIDKDNFEASLEKIKADIDASEFVAIDLELSGVSCNNWTFYFI